MTQEPKTLIIIPAFNEEAALPLTLKGLRKKCPQFDVVVIDDGSSDRTAAAAREAKTPVVSLPFNLGIGAALRTGFKYAVDNEYDRAIQFDADGQHSEEEISQLIIGLDHGADMVVGSRFADKETPYEAGMIRTGAMRLLRILVSVLSGHTFTDTSSGFRAFTKPVLEFFARTYPSEYMDSVEALLLALYAGFRVTEVPVKMNVRVAGQPSNRNFRLIYHYLRLMIVLITTISISSRRHRKARKT